MSLGGSLKEIIKNPRMIICSLGNHNLLNWMPSDMYLKLLYKARTGKKLDLVNPKGYCEKLQWIKVYLHDPLYVQLVDKYTVRKYIADKIGEKYLIPVIHVWDNASEINPEELPDQFVLKCTHDSGSITICKNKASFDFEAARQKLTKHLKQGTYWATREWPYKNVTPRIIAEQYMEDESGIELKDYKVLCFDGKPKLIELHMGRYRGTHTQDFYDTEWNLTGITQNGCVTSDKPYPKPECFDEMLRLSTLLAEGFPHIRVDWYVVNGRLYFGELTFFDASGFDLFDDPKVERMLGDWITLPEK